MEQNTELMKRQAKHERNATKAQKEIEAILKKRGLALVANYVKEQNTVHLELIPTELLKARSIAMQAVQDQKELIQGTGDPIAPKNPADDQIKPHSDSKTG